MALSTLSPQFGATVGALHRVAEQIVAPARKPDNEIALQATPGGFGTPPFEHDGAAHQVRVEGAELVDGERRAPLTSLESARAIVADLVPGQLDDAPLGIDAASAAQLADAYEFGADILQQLIDDAQPGDDPTPAPILWPEHFDIAIELGADKARANLGLSPGDSDNPEPYLYVGPWTASPSGELWNAPSFNGAKLTYSHLVAAADQRAAALEFFNTRIDALRRI